MRIAITLALLFAALAQPIRADDITAEAVRKSIDRGVAYVKSKQNKDGSWTEIKTQPGGVSALCTLALLSAGESRDDESMQRSLEYLRSLEAPKVTYAAAWQILALVAADPSPENKDIALIRRNAELLADFQAKDGNSKGSWGYSKTLGSGDNSNAQIALLALHEAQRVGVTTPDEMWGAALDHWLAAQGENGGWAYLPKESSRGSMTCAGIASVIICSQRLKEGDPRRKASQEAVDQGLAWLNRNFSVVYHPVEVGPRGDVAVGRAWLLYYLCGVERAGRMADVPQFQTSRGEKIDWYREGSAMLVRHQDDLNGSWQGVGKGEDDPIIATSLAIVFLARGGSEQRMPQVEDDAQSQHGEDR